MPEDLPRQTGRKQGFYRRAGKRLFDLCVSVPAAILLLPVGLFVALLVFLQMGRPVIYSQERPGKNAKIFSIYKFRTMTNETDKDGNLLPDPMRLTGFGRFLRSTSLDELPEIWNIIRGEMSLVGPRPLLTRYLPLYSPEQARRHEVAPGLTGLAQISGRNAISWPEKFAADITYVDNFTFRMDVAILLKTILKILRRDGISAPGEATMPYFMGNDDDTQSRHK